MRKLSCNHPFSTGGQVITIYSKTCLNQPLKIDKTKALKTKGSLKQVKSIAECSLGAFCNAFDLHKVIISLQNQFLVSLLFEWPLKTGFTVIPKLL